MVPKGTPSIVVVGSHAPGIFVRVHRLPKPGETIIGWDFQEPVDGGKGSNQAIAAARLGVHTSFVGSVGNDRLGQEAREWMSAAGVDLRYLFQSPALSTGVGFNLLDDDGVPAMVTVRGANVDLDENRVEQALAGLAGARVMLTQFEIRPEIALHAAAQARQRNMLTIVNPAPACRVPLSSLAVADYLTPNETEAKVLLGYEPDQSMDHTALAEELRTKSKVGCVIITLGENGIVGVDESGRWQVRPPSVKVIDTSGAGDAFCAALAVGLVQGLGCRAASDWACKVATLSVTRAGTIPAYPSMLELKDFLNMVS